MKSNDFCIIGPDRNRYVVDGKRLSYSSALRHLKAQGAEPGDVIEYLDMLRMVAAAKERAA